MRILVIVPFILAFLGCAKEPSTTPPPVAPPLPPTAASNPPPPKAEPAPPPAPEPPPPPEESMAQKLGKVGSCDSAIALCKSEMTDTVDESSKGQILLAIWAVQRMRWSDVNVARNETTFALAQKDSDEARGKRLCVSGMIVQISVEKTDFGKINSGLLLTNSGNIHSFMNVGSSGDLVQNSRTRMCGVVTGKYDYHNSAGGTGHALASVGMFDLPQNRTL